jgi:hypothetical protein
MRRGLRAHLAARRTLGVVRACDRYPDARRFGVSIRPDGDAAADAFARLKFAKVFFVAAIETGCYPVLDARCFSGPSSALRRGR